MIFTGTGSPYTAKVLPTFKPKTTLGIKWVELSDGNFCAVDRGADSDVYEADITLAGQEGVIQNFFTMLQTTRAAGQYYFNITSFNSGEYIFGADIDYTATIPATVVKLGKKVQTSCDAYTLSMTLRATSLSFTGSATMPTLKPLVGYDGNATYTLDTRDSYDGSMRYADLDRDAGQFTATYRLTDTEMKNLRRYIATQRSTAFNVASINGVLYPWGNRSATFPLNVKIISWQDLGMVAWGNAAGSAVRNWAIQMTLSEVI